MSGGSRKSGDNTTYLRRELEHHDTSFYFHEHGSSLQHAKRESGQRTGYEDHGGQQCMVKNLLMEMPRQSSNKQWAHGCT